MKYLHLFLILWGLYATSVLAVTGRSPTGVNVNSNGVSTVLITFQNLAPNERTVDAFWCGDVTSSGVVVGTNPCVTGTLFGHLPKRLDLSRITGSANIGESTKSVFKQRRKSAAPRNLTDIMTIPPAVIRRAYQDAQQGKSSEFFYVRQFNNNGINTYVTVTCRLAGGGARSPLALTRVALNFNTQTPRKSITFVKQSAVLNKFSAHILFTGAGLLKGRWEVVLPGDVGPSRFDLLSEASLPAAQRALQKRFRLLSRFQKFLPPNGKVTIPGPNPKLLPTSEKGLYRILLRIEASDDKEGNSDTLAGILNTGGVAGFPMPTLRYFVGQTDAYQQQKIYPPLSLLLPLKDKAIRPQQLKFSWFGLKDEADVATYRIEFYQQSGERKLLASAFIETGVYNYQPILHTLGKLKQPFLWRVVALNSKGKVLSSSALRKLKLLNNNNSF